jgi:hypothetical protein
MWFINKEWNYLFLPTLCVSYRTSKLLPPPLSSNLS